MEIDPHQTEFFVSGEPAPQSRPRVTRRGGVYYAQKIVAYRKAVELAARCAGVPIRTGPLWLGIAFVFTRPKSHYKSDGSLSKTATAFPFGKGDCTNLAKGVEDSLEDIAYANDNQIVELSVAKRWKKENEEAGTYVTICDVYPLPAALEKRRDSICRQWTKAERTERDTTQQIDIHGRRMIGWKDALAGELNDDFIDPFESS